MSRQCDARIQIATSRSLELDPEFAASMFYCVRDPLHEGPHWITMPSKSESPAPPPCKAESLSWEGQARLYKALHANCDLTIAAKDAEIAELRAFHDKILGAWDYSQAGGKGSNNPFIRRRKLYRLVRETIEQGAALAPKVSHD